MATWARPIVHWEIQARDPERIRAFYETMFEWVITPGPVPAIVNIGAGIGGPEPGPGGHIQPGEGKGVVLYIQVADVKASMAQAEELGGAILGAAVRCARTARRSRASPTPRVTRSASSSSSHAKAPAATAARAAA